MKTITHTVAAFIATTMLATNVQAQQNPNYVAAKDSTTTPPPTRDHPDRMKSLITGDAFFGYKFVNNRGLNKANQSTFTTLAVNPVWLWKLTDKLSFEGETEFQSSLWQEDPTATSGMAVGAGLAVELETCNLQYKINPYMMLKVGEFFTPYGVAEDWYHQRITDRMIDRPIGIGHGGIEAGSDMGACLQGGVPLPFGAKLHYAAALLQGQKLISDGQQVLSNGVKFNNNGALDIENIIAHTTAKTWVARVGYLPVPWFEIGGWYGSGKVNADNDKLNTGNVMAVHLGGYLSIIKTMPAIKGTVILRSQYSQQNIGDAVFANTSGVGTYTFSNNNSSAYYVQASYRPVLAGKVLGMFELAARYGQMTLPDQAQKQWILPGSTQGPNPYQSKSQVAVSLNCWLKWNACFKIQYSQGKNDAIGGKWASSPPATWSCQFVMGF